jgi:hypothetical protein
VSEEREVKDLEIEDPGTEQDDVEAHQKKHGPFSMDSTSNDDGDDVEAHVKKHTQ